MVTWMIWMDKLSVQVFSVNASADELRKRKTVVRRVLLLLRTLLREAEVGTRPTLPTATCMQLRLHLRQKCIINCRPVPVC